MPATSLSLRCLGHQIALYSYLQVRGGVRNLPTEGLELFYQLFILVIPAAGDKIQNEYIFKYRESQFRIYTKILMIECSSSRESCFSFSGSLQSFKISFELIDQGELPTGG